MEDIVKIPTALKEQLHEAIDELPLEEKKDMAHKAVLYALNEIGDRLAPLYKNVYECEAFLTTCSSPAHGDLATFDDNEALKTKILMLRAEIKDTKLWLENAFGVYDHDAKQEVGTHPFIEVGKVEADKLYKRVEVINKRYNTLSKQFRGN